MTQPFRHTRLLWTSFLTSLSPWMPNTKSATFGLPLRNYAQNLEMRRFSRRFLWVRPARKRVTCTARELPKAGRRNQVRQITKHRCRRRRAIIRFRHQLRFLLIPLPHLTHYWLRRVQAQAPVRCPLPRHRLLPERPPHRRLESLICHPILLRPGWLPWLSHWSSKAILSSRCSHDRSTDF